ncbi:hypothetical protein [Thermoflexus sp.]|uniref:hypothetical protein n=1 Tax=Thermoflexus sp. TaxID=1969742 RepID=UPI00260B424F|nr:hypothetical protein [Thermoflexus sp.]
MRGVPLRELVETTLPPGTRVLGGRDGLDREVTWATLLRTLPARTAIQRGDLLLFSVDLLFMREPPLSFPALLEVALEREAAAPGRGSDPARAWRRGATRLLVLCRSGDLQHLACTSSEAPGSKAPVGPRPFRPGPPVPPAPR